MTENLTIDSATEKTIDLEPGPIHYREVGSGKPLVFIHGLLVNGLLWRKVVPALAPTFRCIVPDLPLGSHRTPMSPDADLSPPGLAKIIGDFLDKLEIENATLVANDTGGALTQILAATKPERIGRMVLTPCDMFDNFLPTLFQPLQAVGGSPFGLAVLAQLMRINALRGLPLAFGFLAKHGIEKSVADRYLQPTLKSARIRHDTNKILRGISSEHTMKAAEGLKGFDRPTLLAWASEDRVFPLDHAHRMASILANARVEVIDDSYSFVPEDQPEKLAALIADFAA